MPATGESWKKSHRRASHWLMLLQKIVLVLSKLQKVIRGNCRMKEVVMLTMISIEKSTVLADPIDHQTEGLATVGRHVKETTVIHLPVAERDVLAAVAMRAIENEVAI